MDASRKRNGNGDDKSTNQKRRNTGDLKFTDDYLDSEIIPVTIKGSDTIDKIRLEIQTKAHIPFDQQELLIKQKIIGNTNTLANFPINIKESDYILMSESRGFMNIFIKNLEGRLINFLQVKPSDTIGNVKVKMHGFHHMLIFNGVVLEDNQTLADLNIINGSTLTGVEISKAKMEIFVVTFTGKTISLEATPTDTIANIKLEIMYTERVPVNEQVLIFKGMALVDSGTLCDFHINGKSTLTLVRRSRGLMQISIKTFGEETFTLDVNPSHSIGSIKSKIQDKKHIPHDEQELIFNEMVLDNIDTLADLHINGDSTLTLVRISAGRMNIVIKMESGYTINMKVKPSNTVYDMKSKIGDMQGIPRCQLILHFGRKHLQDGATLADYHIHDNQPSIVSLFCKLVVYKYLSYFEAYTATLQNMLDPLEQN
ncbi:hypothetical protein E3N88_14562 [Mikania micrantha]|uniref:Ubiquitin-like domain-containing protein n=1 Tax=Mikania micrantha TaxID=192012 RepID=A0A5N6P223_9ASTR|nr:hypothetical protein E3N88_14562 [Mikania micrantha]